MIEFGSDFYSQSDFVSEFDSINNVYQGANYFATGRHPIIALIKKYKWARIWMPEYFCYEVINSIEKTGIKIAFYKDYPNQNEEAVISKIPFNKTDVLFRVNYFGIRKFRNNSNIPVPVIEDHSHDLISNWALHSNANWCIASLRKSLPISEGGIIWSPLNLELPKDYISTQENESMAQIRWQAMEDKAHYIQGNAICKDEFRSKFIETETIIDRLPISGISRRDMDAIKRFDIRSWYEKKQRNWNIIIEKIGTCIPILRPETTDSTPFSAIFVFNDNKQRNDVRSELINHNVYPAILWPIPSDKSPEIIEFGERMLSIHCDARYNDDDIRYLCNIIFSILNNDTNN